MTIYSNILPTPDPEFNNIQVLTSDDYVHIFDIFDDAVIDTLYSKGQPRAIISDHIQNYSHPKYGNLDIIYIPGFIQLELNGLPHNYFNDENKNVKQCFNFTFNMFKMNRALCMKFVEWFDLHDYDYTWSGVMTEMPDRTYTPHHGTRGILQELYLICPNFPEFKNILEFRTLIQSNINLNPKFCTFKGVDINDVTEFGVFPYGTNWGAWNNGIGEIISSSAVTLIGESAEWEKAAALTEKTLFATLGRTFPIWVGGYKQAEAWSSLGFDVFDDIIDHSYQYYDTLVERCYYAIKNNLHILNDITYATEQVNQNLDRLTANQDLALSNNFKNIITKQLQTVPNSDFLKKYFLTDV